MVNYGRKKADREADKAAAAQPPTPPRTMTAAVSRVSMDIGYKAWKFGDRAWQMDAWRLYDITGQLRFIANWVGNSVSRCRLYVAELDEDGEPTGEVTNPEIAALAKGPLGSGAAKDESLRLLGINLFVPGESYIIAEADGNGPGDDRWFVVSGSQIKRTGDEITINRSQLQGSGVMTYREGKDLILRVWTPHPRQTDEPDSPTRSAIPDLREIEATRKRIFAELDSRLAGAGLLALPDDIDFPRNEGEDTSPSSFAGVLMRTMAASLQDRASAEAMVPIIVQGKADAIEKIRHVTFWSELSDQLLPLRTQAITSLAQSLDIPPEVLLGMGGTNHWSAWAISEEAVTTQIVPVLTRIADALTLGYLRHALDEMGEEPDRYVYAFDTAPLTTRPNRVSDGLSFYDKGLISADATREAGAFSDDDAPKPEEVVYRLVVAAVQQNPALVTDPIVQQILGIGAIAPVTAPQQQSPAIESGDTEPDDDPESEPDTQPGNEDAPPEQDDDRDTAALYPVANLAVRRALTLAGTRLVPNRRDRYPGVAKHALYVRSGPVSRDKALTVLDGAWDDLHAVADDLMVDGTQLEDLLTGFCVELLTRGMAYDQTLLREVLRHADPPPRAVTAS